MSTENWYHVLVQEHSQGAGYSWVYEVNLTEDIVLKQIIHPFYSKNKFLCDGHVFDPDKISKLRVYKTDKALVISKNKTKYDKEDMVKREGVDVTRQFTSDIQESNVRSITLNFNEIFIVHGHDEVSKLGLARMLENDLQLKAVILHEQPNQGKTIIEKLERYSSGPGYAIVILTPDDVGGENKEPPVLSPRPRQNVVLELGYFIGKLGRDRVCVLHKGNVEIPSDISGVLFIQFKESINEVYFELTKELKHAGFLSREN